jgi:hypothetical protein
MMSKIAEDALNVAAIKKLRRVCTAITHYISVPVCHHIQRPEHLCPVID